MTSTLQVRKRGNSSVLRLWEYSRGCRGDTRSYLNAGFAKRVAPSYMFCSKAIGEANPARDIEKTKTSKADLVAALKDGVAYCNKAFDSMTDAKGSQMVKFFNFDTAKLTMFSINTAHTNEHYGNMVTYLRLKGIVPPTSENQSAQPP